MFWDNLSTWLQDQVYLECFLLINYLAACRERQQPSNHPWAKLIQRPESRMSYSPQLRAQWERTKRSAGPCRAPDMSAADLPYPMRRQYGYSRIHMPPHTYTKKPIRWDRICSCLVCVNVYTTLHESVHLQVKRRAGWSTQVRHWTPLRPLTWEKEPRPTNQRTKHQKTKQKSLFYLIANNRYLETTGAGKQSKAFYHYLLEGKRIISALGCKPISLADVEVTESSRVWVGMILDWYLF